MENPLFVKADVRSAKTTQKLPGKVVFITGGNAGIGKAGRPTGTNRYDHSHGDYIH